MVIQASIRYSNAVRNRVAIRWARNPLLAALLLAAFLGRALIPAGFMPGPGGLMLCSGYAPNVQTNFHDMSGMDMSGMDTSGMDISAAGTAHRDGDAGHGGRAPDHTRSEICPFAAAAMTMVAFNAPVVVVHSYVVSTELIIPAPPVVPRGTIVPTRLPRGPPIYS